MSLGQVALLALAAVLLFWLLGAYNRLVALRNVVTAAWTEVDDALTRRAKSLLTLVALLRGLMVDEADSADSAGALDALHASQTALATATDTMRQRPLAVVPASALAQAEGQLATAADRVLALLAGRPDIATMAEVATLHESLEAAGSRLAFARQRFNEAAQTYNDAARQFPTRLLTRLYGFGTAGRI